MSFLNLGLGELLGIVTAVSAGVVALYLLDRSKRRQLVATLRFWTTADVRTELKHRRRIQQPWSLVLQLVSLALLLVAIAGPQFGVLDARGRDHVLILDTSAWMGAAQGPNQPAPLIDLERAAARAWVRTVPGRDRIMVLRADDLATPATSFESNRQTIEEAIRGSQPGSSALDLEQALTFAQSSQQMQGTRPGEIVFIGAGRVSAQQTNLNSVPKNLRFIPVGSSQENVGLRKIGLRRIPEQPDVWDIFVAVRNYGSRPRSVDLAMQFSRSPAGTKQITIQPGAEETAEFTYREKAAGYLEVRLNAHDVFPGDDRALIELPSQTVLNAVVYSKHPEILRPLFSSSPQIATRFLDPDQYDRQVQADLIVLDSFAPAAPPQKNSIWIEPPADGSPIPIRSKRNGVKLERWRPETTLGAGLRTKDVTLESAEVFAPAPGDTTVAEAQDGPVIVARGGPVKTVVLGFNPERASMKYELATPLLVANILRWMTPGTFRRWELQAGTVGTVNVPVEKNTDPGTVRVLDENQRALPFTVEGNVLRFFAGAPGTVSVHVGDREIVYSLTLPDVAEAVWRVPADVRRGVPRGAGFSEASTEIWPWLALAGGLGLLADWLLFGRSRAFRLRAARMAVWRRAA
jgi:hypothetical protein